MDQAVLVGFDIGGTKCSVTIGLRPDEPVASHVVETPGDGPAAGFYASLVDTAVDLLARHGIERRQVAATGVVCGGPVDEDAGLVLGPPNLPGWDHVDVLSPVRDVLSPKARLVNDANASVLAEWRFGAAQHHENVVFLTFGTGMGAGLVLHGRLYRGGRGGAGEVGRIPMCREFDGHGLVRGTFESLCSGGGIARLATRLVSDGTIGTADTFLPTDDRTTRAVFEAARAGKDGARRVVAFSGAILADGLRTIVDVVDPDLIVLGSIFVRSHDLLAPVLARQLACEPDDIVCNGVPVVAAALGSSLGDVASLMVAAEAVGGGP